MEKNVSPAPIATPIVPLVFNKHSTMETALTAVLPLIVNSAPTAAPSRKTHA
jgi:hypothetical protein